MKNYSVNIWGSKPGTNDDCWFGDEYETLDAAMRVFEDPSNEFNLDSDCVFVELDGHSVHKERRLNSDHVADDSDWEHEIAVQAGMGLGVQAYNDAYGY